ncbi:MAG: ABC transporter ATP-binding protein, partial [Lentisphaeria bacterium]
LIQAEEKVAQLEELLGSEDFYEKHGERLQEVMNELELAKEKVEYLYERWELLSSKAEGN